MEELREICETLARWLAAPPPAAPPDWSSGRWGLCRQAAHVHGVAPLLARRLCGLAAWSGHPACRWLADQHDANRRRLARMHGELRMLLARFDEAGVAVVPLKGALLTVRFYSEPGDRPMADFDLLLRPADLERGGELLSSLGYEKVAHSSRHALFERPGERTPADSSCEHPDNPRPVELHASCRERICEQVSDLTELMWDGARRGELLGARAWIAAPELLWLHLLMHTMHHMRYNSARLLQLVDLTRVAAHLADWTNLGGLLDRFDPRATYAPLSLLQRCFPDPRLAALVAAQRPRLSAGFAAWAERVTLFDTCYLNPQPWRDG
ncbi:MAG TPA: nucleotidyltransferase family protein [Thermoanaerobaculia bacterium]|nr:nucleotidyltransferase family protein [Thermoanaerobaculia bacterium]